MPAHDDFKRMAMKRDGSLTKITATLSSDVARARDDTVARRTPREGRAGVAWWIGLGLLAVVVGCAGDQPSARVNDKLQLPAPAVVEKPADPARLKLTDHGAVVKLSPLSVIETAFNHQPDIKSSYARFKSEEARYDFFYVSRDALTPSVKLSNTVDESREPTDEDVIDVTRERKHAIELGLKKQFFDTTEMELGMGFRSETVEGATGNQPYVSASVRYPLWASRKRLERASEDIFRRNELNDTRLGYIKQVRNQLSRALSRFHRVLFAKRDIESLKRWKADLEHALEIAESIRGRDVTTDRQRLKAEISRVEADIQRTTGEYEILLTRLKAECGLPFYAKLELIDTPFNPFDGMSREELVAQALKTDPELATLRNAVHNAEAQLDLAKRGRWDVALFLSGQADLEGADQWRDHSDWTVTGGLEVSAVDRRVTSSLMRQAQSDITRYTRAIEAREDLIFADALESIVRIETLTASRDNLAGSLKRFQTDYEEGLAEYERNELNIDDLLKRRETLYDQEEEIAGMTYRIGQYTTYLCSTTGKFFELLHGPTPESAPSVRRRSTAGRPVRGSRSPSRGEAADTLRPPGVMRQRGSTAGVPSV